MALAPTKIPFFVPAPFVVKADMYKMGSRLITEPEAHVFCLDDSYPVFVEAKLDQLEHHAKHARCYMRDAAEQLTGCLWRVAALMAEDQPEYFIFAEGCLTAPLLGLSLGPTGLHKTSTIFPLQTRCFEHLEPLSLFDQLCDFLALAVQEDLVIMHKTGAEANADRAECLLVALPSHWDPREKCGQDFGAIHEPVADNAPLLKAQPNLIKAMISKGPFVRYNWSLAGTEALAQNPKILATEPRHINLRDSDTTDLLDRLWFRVERQTFYPFPDLSRSLFAIRIFQEPLRLTVAKPEQRGRLSQAISTMSAEMLRYKGIDSYQAELLKRLA